MRIARSKEKKELVHSSLPIDHHFTYFTLAWQYIFNVITDLTPFVN